MLRKNFWKFAFLAVAMIFCTGIVVGACYSAKTGGETDSALHEYLNGFFQGFAADQNRLSVFQNSLLRNLKLFFLLFASAFFRGGILLIGAGVFSKGFVSGFTTAAFAKYYGIRGLLIPAASMVSNLLFFPALLGFSVCGIWLAAKKQKKDKNVLRSFFLLSAICLTIFCVKSFFDGYVTTTFMKLLIPFVTVV